MPDVNFSTAEARAASTVGLRFDAGKERIDLIPPEIIFALGDLYRKGAEKYSEHNWEKGMDWSRIFRSLMSHAWRFWRGEDYDEETGCHHMTMAAWNAIALYVYFERKIGNDNRHVPGGPEATS